MIAACFIFTDFHDIMMNIGSFLGVIALSFTLLGLFRFQYYRLFWSGVGCIFIVGINNLIYYTHYFIDYLPVIQKVSFVFVLFWVGVYCAEGLKKKNLTAKTGKDQFLKIGCNKQNWYLHKKILRKILFINQIYNF